MNDPAALEDQADNIDSIIELRCKLMRGGFSPIPVSGKRPVFDNWQSKVEMNAGEIDTWGRLYPSAVNTGLLCQRMPALDIDILDPDAAAAVVDLVRLRFEDELILIRTGLAPKRAILFRASGARFRKIDVSLIAANGSTGQKIEFLGAGQQVVAYGIHPDTGKPYSWFGGEPAKIRLDDLPDIDEAAAQALVFDIVAMLEAGHGYKPAKARPRKAANGNGSYINGGGSEDWSYLIEAIIAGNALHESLRDLAAKLVRSGMKPGAAVNNLRAWMRLSNAPRDVRWQARFDDIPRLVAGAETFREPEPAPGEPAPDPQPQQTRRGPLILSGAAFVSGFKPPDYLIDGMIQQSYLYSLTARTGHGKTAVAMYAAQCVARGVLFHGRKTKQGAVLFLAGENPDDVRARYMVQADQEGFDPADVPIYFIDGVINIWERLSRIKAEADKIPDLVLVIVDTAAAYFRGDEDNSNTQKLIFAQQLRALTRLPGKPATIVNCHPVKNASQDNLIPVGGGAFLNEMDGNLPLWADDKVCTLSAHLDKWRGVSFEPVSFDLKTSYCDKVVDAEGRQMPSVIAVPITEAMAQRKEVVMENDEDTVLRLLNADKKASFSDIARRAGWLWPDGKPSKSKVQKVVERLRDEKLVYKSRRKYRLTKKGAEAIKVEWDGDE